MEARHDSFNNPTLVGAVATHERWGESENQRFETLRDRINATDRVDEAFLVVRGGGEPIVERAVAVASSPRWESARLRDTSTPILDALAELDERLQQSRTP
jgi:hypothetical protein